MNLCIRLALGILNALLVFAQQPLVLFDVFPVQLGVKSMRVPLRIHSAQLAIDYQEDNGIRIGLATQQNVLAVGVPNNFAYGELRAVEECRRILIQKNTCT